MSAAFSWKVVALRTRNWERFESRFRLLRRAISTNSQSNLLQSSAQTRRETFMLFATLHHFKAPILIHQGSWDPLLCPCLQMKGPDQDSSSAWMPNLWHFPHLQKPIRSKSSISLSRDSYILSKASFWPEHMFAVRISKRIFGNVS